MFYEGSLQSGISVAIQQRKTVACFVHDDGEQSQTWENDWLADETVSKLFEDTTVLFRIRSGTEEAEFLSAVCPVDEVPLLVFITDGSWGGNIGKSESKEAFLAEVQKALGMEAGVDNRQAAVTAESATERQAESAENVEVAPQPRVGPGADAARSNTDQNTQALPASRSDTVTPVAPQNLTSLFPERQANLEATHARQQAAETERLRAVRARQEAEAAAAAAASSSNGKGSSAHARSDYAAQQRQRLAAARADRERVMAAIENDKAERRERERARKEAERMTSSAFEPAESSALPSSQAAHAGRKAGAAGSANVQIRLFSGRTIRERFPATATVSGDLRPWVDEAVRDDVAGEGGRGRAPAYIFKHILNPLPSREIGVAEEIQSFLDLGLLPSATLVLVEVQGGSEAYAGAGGGLVGMAYGAASGAFGLASGAFGLATSTLGAVAGGVGGLLIKGDSTSQEHPQQDSEGQGAGEDVQSSASEAKKQEARKEGTIRVRTLADQREEAKSKEGETWYNGNQTSFQPKPKDDSNDKSG